jgi:hypothetical protein
MAKTQYDNLKVQMDKFGADLIKELANQLIIADKKATGSLIDSLDYELLVVLGDFVINITANDYLYWVDQGRKRGKTPPPQKAIRKWIDIRGVQRFRDKKGRFISKDSQAFIIARSIGKKGIQKTNVIKKATNKLLAAKRDLITKAAGQDLKEFAKNILINA